MSSNDSLLHFGLGEVTEVDRVIIDWPGAGRQVLTGLKAGNRYTLTQPDELSPAKKKEPAKTMFVRSGVLPGVIPKERIFDDFARQPLLPAKHSQMGPGIAIGDVNRDGREDVYISFPSGSSGRIQQRKTTNQKGESSFATSDTNPFSVDSKSEDMAPLFFDADNDGDLDLYIVSGGVEGETGDGVFRDRLYLNAGDGMFAKAPSGMLPDATISGSVVCAADYDLSLIHI